MKRTRLRRRSGRASIVRELDALTKQVMLRDRGDTCWRCGKQPVQAAHIMPKGQYRHLRYRPDNLLPLCYACHIHWAHKNPLDFHALLVERLGAGEVERLTVMAHQHHGKVDLKLTRLWLLDSLGISTAAKDGPYVEVPVRYGRTVQREAKRPTRARKGA